VQRRHGWARAGHGEDSAVVMWSMELMVAWWWLRRQQQRRRS
jgi:hypothetical protein